MEKKRSSVAVSEDNLARMLVRELQERDLLEIATPNTQPVLIAGVADLMGSEATIEDLGTWLEEQPGVVDLYATDEDLEEILARSAEKLKAVAD